MKMKADFAERKITFRQDKPIPFKFCLRVQPNVVEHCKSARRESHMGRNPYRKWFICIYAYRGANAQRVDMWSEA